MEGTGPATSSSLVESESEKSLVTAAPAELPGAYAQLQMQSCVHTFTHKRPTSAYDSVRFDRTRMAAATTSSKQTAETEGGAAAKKEEEKKKPDAKQVEADFKKVVDQKRLWAYTKPESNLYVFAPPSGTIASSPSSITITPNRYLFGCIACFVNGFAFPAAGLFMASMQTTCIHIDVCKLHAFI